MDTHFVSNEQVKEIDPDVFYKCHVDGCHKSFLFVHQIHAHYVTSHSEKNGK